MDRVTVKNSEYEFYLTLPIISYNLTSHNTVIKEKESDMLT